MPASTDALFEVVSLATALGLGPPDAGNSSDGADGDAVSASAAPSQSELLLLQARRASSIGASASGGATARGAPAGSRGGNSSGAAMVVAVADATQELCARHLSDLAARRAAAAGDLSDASVTASRAAAMSAVTATMRTAVDQKHAVSDRLRAAKLRPAVTVDPSKQAEFTGLLRRGAGGRGDLQRGAHALAWAAALDAPPSCWEDTLQAIPEGARACRAHLQAITEFRRELDSASGGAAVKGVGGVGGASVEGSGAAAMEGGGGSRGVAAAVAPVGVSSLG